MGLSSDTIRSASASISSTLRHHELDDILAMEWWLDEMTRHKDKPRTGIDDQRVREILAQALDPISKNVADIATEHKAIRKKLETGPESPWRKAARLVISVGAPLTIVAVFLTLLGVTFGALYQSFSHVRDEATFRTHTEDRLTAIEKRMDGIDARLAELRLLMASNQPTRKEAQQIAKQVITDARGQSTPISASVVEQSGRSFVEAAKTEPSSWGVALQLVSYRSHLNASELPKLKNVQPLPNKDTIKPTIPFVTGPYDTFSPKFKAAGRVLPAADAAYLEWQGVARPIFKSGSGPEYVIIDGTGTQDSISLDGATLRNVVFTDLVIVYSGGPLNLQTVTFVNCTFKITASAAGISLANALLKGPFISLALS